MKKLPLLLGALGGGLAGYLFSNKPLRDQLAKTKDAKAAAQILGKHLAKDGERIAKDVKEFVESDTVQGGIKNAKKYANDQYKKAKTEIKKLGSEGATAAKSTARKAKRKITSKVRVVGSAK